MAQDDLKGIVQRMLDAGESEENIATVIQHYKANTPEGRLAVLKTANATPLQSPDTFGEGFQSSLGNTAGRTALAIAKSPVNAAVGLYEAAKAHSTALPGADPNAPSMGESLKSLTTPEGGGQAIGDLLMMLAGIRAPKIIGAAREKAFTAGQRLQDIAETIRDETAGHYRPSARAVSLSAKAGGRLLEALGKPPVPPIPDIELPTGGNPNWQTAPEYTWEPSPSQPTPPTVITSSGGRMADLGGLETATSKELLANLQSKSAAIRDAAEAELRRRSLLRD